MALSQSGQDIPERCAQLAKESGQYSQWKPDGGWELSRKWDPLTAKPSVKIMRLATFKTDWDTRETPSELPKLNIVCSGGDAFVEFILERWGYGTPWQGYSCFELGRRNA